MDYRFRSSKIKQWIEAFPYLDTVMKNYIREKYRGIFDSLSSGWTWDELFVGARQFSKESTSLFKVWIQSYNTAHMILMRHDNYWRLTNVLYSDAELNKIVEQKQTITRQEFDTLRSMIRSVSAGDAMEWVKRFNTRSEMQDAYEKLDFAVRVVENMLAPINQEYQSLSIKDECGVEWKGVQNLARDNDRREVYLLLNEVLETDDALRDCTRIYTDAQKNNTPSVWRQTLSSLYCVHILIEEMQYMVTTNTEAVKKSLMVSDEKDVCQFSLSVMDDEKEGLTWIKHWQRDKKPNKDAQEDYPQLATLLEMNNCLASGRVKSPEISAGQIIEDDQ
jgi:hypothetical protein